MLQTRPSSSGGMLPPQNQPPSPYVAAQQPRTTYYGSNNMGSAPVMYRAAAAPIQPYAFTSTPNLHLANNWQSQPQPQPQPQYMPGSGIRSSTTAPSLPRLQSFDSSINLGRTSRTPASPSTASPSAGGAPAARYVGSRDDSMASGQGVRRGSGTARPQSAAYLTASAPQLSFTQATPVRPSPERYRRPSGTSSQQQKQMVQSQASAMPSGSGMASVGHLYSSNGGSGGMLPDQQNSSSARIQPRTVDARPSSFHDNMLNGQASDDIQIHRQTNEETKRFRRRSMSSMNASDYTITPVLPRPEDTRRQQQYTPQSPIRDKSQTLSISQRPVVVHSQAGSSESVVSSNSGSRPEVSLAFSSFFVCIMYPGGGNMAVVPLHKLAIPFFPFIFVSSFLSPLHTQYSCCPITVTAVYAEPVN